MASRPEFVQYVADQCAAAGEITCRKMFGNYGIYLNGKIFGLICNDQLFIKVTQPGKELAPDCPLAPPYEGAKPHFLIEDLEDREFLTAFITATYDALPTPKPKKSGCAT